MIRRWSCVNTSNTLVSPDFSSNAYFFSKKKIKIYVFKKSVYYKKFKFKYTKFKRRRFVRLKHVTNLLLYTNVFKFWSTDYFFNKHATKYQFLINIFSRNAVFYNSNFIKNKNENVFNNFNFLYSSWSKRSYFLASHLSRNNLVKTAFFFKNINISTAWFVTNPIEIKEALYSVSQWDAQMFDYYVNNAEPSVADLHFNWEEIFTLILDIISNKYSEIYKIILYYFYLSL